MKIYIATQALPEEIADNDEKDNVEEILWAGYPYTTLAAAVESIVKDVQLHAAEAGEKPPAKFNWIVKTSKRGPSSVWRTEVFDVQYLIREYEI